MLRYKGGDVSSRHSNIKKDIVSSYYILRNHRAFPLTDQEKLSGGISE